MTRLSLLSWERGLKFTPVINSTIRNTVAPLVGAWIEIVLLIKICLMMMVAPLVGAWIEMLNCEMFSESVLSLLSWERGLKYICC